MINLDSSSFSSLRTTLYSLMLIKLSFGIFIVTFYYISQKDSNSEFESFKNVAFKLICDAV